MIGVEESVELIYLVIIFDKFIFVKLRYIILYLF